MEADSGAVIRHGPLSQVYDWFYRQSQRLPRAQVQTFILISKTPKAKTLRKFGYKPAEQPGVYRSDNAMLEAFPLLVLNELRDEPHNVFVKSFASRYLARKAALETLRGVGLQAFSPTVQTVLSLIWRQWTMNTGEMELEITPEQIIELSKQWQQIMLASLSPEEVLPYFKPEERLAGLEPEERLAGLEPEERLAGLPIEEIEAYLRKLKSGGQNG
jgi:hypothetical protein